MFHVTAADRKINQRVSGSGSGKAYRVTGSEICHPFQPYPQGVGSSRVDVDTPALLARVFFWGMGLNGDKPYLYPTELLEAILGGGGVWANY